MPVSTWKAVLSEVKQQAAQSPVYNSIQGLTAEAVVPSPDSQTSSWQQQQWQNAFQVLFFEAPFGPSEEQDDLLFFVYLEAYQTEPPYLVRRKAKALPSDLQEHGDKAHQIDWKQSVLLNLVTQTSYILTVAACQREELSSIGNPGLQSKGVVEVSKPVYASTTKSQLNLDKRRANDPNPTVTYPDISFAVENFEEAFRSLLLTQPSQCYLVVLTATAGMTFKGKQLAARAKSQPADAVARSQNAATLQEGVAGQESAEPSSSDKAPKLTVFSGFVSYDQLETKLLADNPKGPKWLHKSADGPHAVRMRGPGGQGFANVAVTCLPQAVAASQSAGTQAFNQQQPPLSPTLSWQELQGHSASPDKGPSQTRGGFLGSALGAASNALRAIANPARSPPDSKPAPTYDMRCALMNLSLPVEPLALQLLQ